MRSRQSTNSHLTPRLFRIFESIDASVRTIKTIVVWWAVLTAAGLLILMSRR
jgi:hypothetical protein